MNQPVDRVREFCRQWRMRKQGYSDQIYGVHIDPNAKMVDLDVNDLEAMIDELAASPADVAKLVGPDCFTVSADGTLHYQGKTYVEASSVTTLPAVAECSAGSPGMLHFGNCS